jgi:hypothetical protein
MNSFSRVDFRNSSFHGWVQESGNGRMGVPMVCRNGGISGSVGMGG